MLVTFLALGLLQSIHAQARETADREGAGHRLPMRNCSLRKQVLVTVDRGETRVAMLEASGDPARRKRSQEGAPRARRSGDVPAGYRVAEIYFERRGGALDRRQHLQGQGRQRPARPRGRLRRHRPRQERLPARRRDRAAGRRAGQARPRQERPAHHRPAQAGAGDRRPGRQGPAEDQGRAALDGAHHRRALHGLRARRARASASRAGSRTRSATACARRPSSSTSAAAARSSAPRRRAPSARTSSASCSTCSSSTRCSQKRVEETDGARHWSSRRPTSRSASCATSSPSTSSARSSTTPSSTTGWSRSSRAPRRSSSTASSCGRSRRTAVRGLRRRPGDRGHARPPRRPAQRRLPDHRLRRGADGDRRQHRLVHRQGQGGPARGHDHQDEPRGGRGGRQPAAAARHRRHHRHRLHRHGPRAQPRRRAQDAAQVARRGPHEDLRGRDLAARAGRDDAPERHRRRARDHDQAVPDLRRRGRREVRGDDRDRGRARSCATMVDEAGDNGAGGLPRAHQPARHPLVHRRRRAQAARARGARPAALLPLRGLRGPAARPLRGHPGGRRATRSSSRPCRSAPATRSTSTSSSRTCTTRTTRSPRSTAT